MLSIGKLSKMFNLSRSAILYYDSIGLLKSSQRSSSGYMLYGEKEIDTLKKIILYRNTGLSLEEIKKLLSKENDNEITPILVKKLGELNRDIADLKNRQKIILELLRNAEFLKRIFSDDFETFNELGRSIGIDDKSAHKWHRDFEANSPELHYQFMKLLGFSVSDINRIIELSKKQL
jgi:DNA-binding transcriptional MerR regulator